MHTYTRKLLHLKFIYNFFNITSSYLHVAVSKKRAAILKNTKIQGGILLRRLLIVSCSHIEFQGFLIRGFCCHLVEIEDVINSRKITLFKYKSWTEQRIRCRQKCPYFEDICFSFRGRTQINSKRGEQLRQSNSGGEIGGFYLLAFRLQISKLATYSFNCF